MKVRHAVSILLGEGVLLIVFAAGLSKPWRSSEAWSILLSGVTGAGIWAIAKGLGRGPAPRAVGSRVVAAALTSSLALALLVSFWLPLERMGVGRSDGLLVASMGSVMFTCVASVWPMGFDQRLVEILDRRRVGLLLGGAVSVWLTLIMLTSGLPLHGLVEEIPWRSAWRVRSAIMVLGAFIAAIIAWRFVGSPARTSGTARSGTARSGTALPLFVVGAAVSTGIVFTGRVIPDTHYTSMGLAIALALLGGWLVDRWGGRFVALGASRLWLLAGIGLTFQVIASKQVSSNVAQIVAFVQASALLFAWLGVRAWALSRCEATGASPLPGTACLLGGCLLGTVLREWVAHMHVFVGAARRADRLEAPLTGIDVEVHLVHLAWGLPLLLLATLHRAPPDGGMAKVPPPAHPRADLVAIAAILMTMLALHHLPLSIVGLLAILTGVGLTVASVRQRA